MPAWAKDAKVVCFFQDEPKYNPRRVDVADIVCPDRHPAAVERQIGALLKQAVGGRRR